MRHTPLLVSQLFDASTHCWNSRLIYELFDEASAHAILKIPLHVSPMQDKLMWILDPKGRFFVKSAYKEAIAHEPGPNPSQGLWKKLWKARLPERIKMLLWRIGSNSIPTKVNLSTRLKHVDPTCPLCKSGTEPSLHLFFECPISMCLWHSACWGFKADLEKVQSHVDIINLILEPPISAIPTQEAWLITLNMALVVDEIWHNRNCVLYQEDHVDIHKSAKSVQSRFLESSKLFANVPPKPSSEVVTTWSPPPTGWIKINVDTAVSGSTLALGVIAQNHKGEVISIWGRCRSSCPPSKPKQQPCYGQLRLPTGKNGPM